MVDCVFEAIAMTTFIPESKRLTVRAERINIYINIKRVLSPCHYRIMKA